jgi:hypothetical protein
LPFAVPICSVAPLEEGILLAYRITSTALVFWLAPEASTLVA